MKLLLSDYLAVLRKRKPCEVLWEEIVDYFDRGHFAEDHEEILIEQMDEWCYHCHKVPLEVWPEIEFENWLAENAIGLWYEDFHCDSPYVVQFYFEEKNDAILFRLRWG